MKMMLKGHGLREEKDTRKLQNNSSEYFFSSLSEDIKCSSLKVNIKLRTILCCSGSGINEV